MIRLRTTFVGAGVAGAAWSETYWDGSDATAAGVAAAKLQQFWSGTNTDRTNTITVSLLPEAEVVDPVTGAITNVVPITSWTFTGTAVDSRLPAASMLLVRFRTGVYAGGREIRGRIFVPGLTEQANAGGVVDTAVLTRTDGAATSGFVDSPAVIYSRTHKVSANIVSASSWNQWAIMRSRRD